MLSLRTFKNLMSKYGEYDMRLKTYSDPRGRKYFSGFITNTDESMFVYVSTESCYNAHCENKMLVRYARNSKDTTGGMNRFVMPQNSAFYINEMFKSPKRRDAELC